MQRSALALAACAVISAIVASPGHYVAIGAGIAAIGTGWIGYARRDAPGFGRLLAAAAIALGSLGVVLGAARVVLVLLAIEHIEHVVPAPDDGSAVHASM
jgi:hypothetical protein